MKNSYSVANQDINDLQAADPDDKDLIQKNIDRRDAAKRLFEDAVTSWKEIRKFALDDLVFYNGNQWDAALKSIGKIRKEPVLTVNRLPQFVKQVENELRQQELTITVAPSDEEGSEELANIYNGMIRSIQVDSKAPTHYIHAAGENGALVPGFGFLKVETDYVNESSFDQKLCICSVFDPFTIIPDPAATATDMSDAGFWFEVHDYTNQDYRNEFPHSKLATADLTAPGIDLMKWAALPEGIRVCRYWYKEKVDMVQYLLEDGTVVDSMRYAGPMTMEEYLDPENEMDGRLPFPKDENGDNKIVSRKRHTVKTTIKWFDFNGAEILDEGTWPSCYFPYVAVIGPQMMVDGRRDIRGIVRYAKDSQKMLNYMASSAARRIASANKSPWIVDAKAIAPYQKQWQTANTENWAMLMYDAYRDEKDANGNSVQNPVPVRADQTGQVNDLMTAAAKFENDLKACVGIYDAGLGRGAENEQSGVAIQTLAQQGMNSNFHFSDNLASSVERLGRILVEMIPRIYSGERAVRIVNPDSSKEVILLNQVFSKNGQTKNYDLSKGQYSVAINTGPAYATRKQAALEQITEVCRIDPQLTPILQDLMVGSMEFDGADVAKERLMKLFAMQYPQLQDQQGLPPLPPQAQAQMAQMHNMIQQLTQELQTLQQEYEKAQFQIKADIVKSQGQMALQKQNSEDDLKLEAMRMKHSAEQAAQQLHIAEVKARLDHVEAMHKTMFPAILKSHSESSNKEEDTL